MKLLVEVRCRFPAKRFFVMTQFIQQYRQRGRHIQAGRCRLPAPLATASRPHLARLFDVMRLFLEAVASGDELCLFLKPRFGFHQAFDDRATRLSGRLI
jgi:hypothetical protein